MNNYTFGKFKGAIVLCKILNESPKHISKITNHWLQRYILELSQLDHIVNKRVRRWWLDRIYHYYKKIINEQLELPYKVKDFSLCVITTLRREILRRSYD